MDYNMLLMVFMMVLGVVGLGFSVAALFKRNYTRAMTALVVGVGLIAYYGHSLNLEYPELYGDLHDIFANPLRSLRNPFDA